MYCGDCASRSVGAPLVDIDDIERIGFSKILKVLSTGIIELQSYVTKSLDAQALFDKVIEKYLRLCDRLGWSASIVENADFVAVLYNGQQKQKYALKNAEKSPVKHFQTDTMRCIIVERWQ